MRLVAFILASLCAACVLRPVIAVAQAPDCERSCRAVADHCSDDSAKQRQPEPTTCDEDLHTCISRCDDQVSGDPAARAAADQTQRQISIFDRLIQGIAAIIFFRTP